MTSSVARECCSVLNCRNRLRHSLLNQREANLRSIRVSREYFSSGSDASVSRPKEFCTSDASNALQKSKKTSTSIASAANLLSSTKKKSSNWRSNVFKVSNGSMINKEVMMEQLSYSDRSVSPITFDVEQQSIIIDAQQLSSRQEFEIIPESKQSRDLTEEKDVLIKGEPQQIKLEEFIAPVAGHVYIRTIKVVEQDSLLLPGERESKIVIIPQPKQISITEQKTAEQKKLVLGTNVPGRKIITPKLKKVDDLKQPMKGLEADTVTQVTIIEEKGIAVRDEIEKQLPSVIRGEKVINNQITGKGEKKKIVQEQDKAAEKKEIKPMDQKGKVKKSISEIDDSDVKLVIAPVNKETYVRTIEAVVRNEILLREEINKEETIVSSSKLTPTIEKMIVTDQGKSAESNTIIGIKIVPKENVPEKPSSVQNMRLPIGKNSPQKAQNLSEKLVIISPKKSDLVQIESVPVEKVENEKKTITRNKLPIEKIKISKIKSIGERAAGKLEGVTRTENQNKILLTPTPHEKKVFILKEKLPMSSVLNAENIPQESSSAKNIIIGEVGEESNIKISSAIKRVYVPKAKVAIHGEKEKKILKLTVVESKIVEIQGKKNTKINNDIQHKLKIMNFPKKVEKEKFIDFKEKKQDGLLTEKKIEINKIRDKKEDTSVVNYIENLENVPGVDKIIPSKVEKKFIDNEIKIQKKNKKETNKKDKKNIIDNNENKNHNKDIIEKVVETKKIKRHGSKIQNHGIRRENLLMKTNLKNETIVPINKETYVRTIEAVVQSEILLENEMKMKEIAEIPEQHSIIVLKDKIARTNRIDSRKTAAALPSTLISTDRSESSSIIKKLPNEDLLSEKSTTLSTKLMDKEKSKIKETILKKNVNLKISTKISTKMVQKLDTKIKNIFVKIPNLQKSVLSGNENEIKVMTKNIKRNEVIKSSQKDESSAINFKNLIDNEISKINISGEKNLKILKSKKILKTVSENSKIDKPKEFSLKIAIENLGNVSVLTEATSTTEKFNLYMNENINNMTTEDISNLIFFLNKGKDGNLNILIDNLDLIAKRINDLILTPWNINQISYVLYGLQSIREKNENYLSILSNMSDILKNYLDNAKNVPRSLAVGIMFLGMQSNSGQTEESKKLFNQMNILLQRCTNTFTPSDVRNVLNSLQKTKSDNSIILEILSSLTSKIKLVDMKFSNQNIVDCLRGLQGMSSDQIETREIISSLIPYIDQCCNHLINSKSIKSQINNQQILSIVNGLKYMKCDNIEVNKLICAILPFFQNCDKVYKRSADISNLIFRFQTIGSDNKEIQQILEYLIPLINYNDTNSILNSTQISNLIFGLSNMNSEIPIVRKLVKTIIPYIENCDEKFTSENIKNIFYGFQNLSSHYSEIREMVSVLTLKLIDSNGIFHAKTLFPALSNLKNLSKIHVEVEEFSKIILLKVKNCIIESSIPNNDFFLPGLNVLEGLGLSHVEVNELKLFLFQKLAESKPKQKKNLNMIESNTEIVMPEIDITSSSSSSSSSTQLLLTNTISKTNNNIFDNSNFANSSKSVKIPLFDSKHVLLSVPLSAPFPSPSAPPPHSPPPSLPLSSHLSTSTSTSLTTSIPTSDPLPLTISDSKSVPIKIRRKITPSTFNPFSDENYFLLVEKCKIPEKKTFRFPYGREEI